ncbi:MAG: hypothetical protein R3F56_26270 [Planctomycetota bacterium]
MRRFATVLSLVLLLAFGLAVSARAQCSPIPGTGCAGQTNPVCGTPPMIGTNFVFRCPPTCFPSTSQFVVIGVPITPAPLPVPPMCAAGCTLGCQPLVVLPAPGATVAIPNNPGLVGAQLCVQCLCQISGTACFTASQATLVVIQ